MADLAAPFLVVKEVAEIGGTPFLVVKRGGKIGGAPFFGGQKGWQKRVADLAAPLFGGQKGWQNWWRTLFWWSKGVAEIGGPFWWSKGVAKRSLKRGAQPNLPPLSATPFDHQNEGRPNLPPLSATPFDHEIGSQDGLKHAISKMAIF